MKKTATLLTLLLLTACTTKQQGGETTESTTEPQTTEAVTEPVAPELLPIEDVDWDMVAEAREFLADLHNPDKYSEFSSNEFVECQCSDEVAKQLRDDYTYEGEGYATWELVGNLLSEAANATAEVIGVGYGNLNGAPTHCITKQYTEGDTQSVIDFYYQLAREEGEWIITYFNYYMHEEE